MRTLAAFFLVLACLHAEWVPLFNGRDLTGWKATHQAVWKVENGILLGHWAPVERGGGGWLMTESDFSDFILRVEFRGDPKQTNSGVAIRDPLRGAQNPSYTGYEVQIHDDPKVPWPTASIYGELRARYLGLKDEGWNTIEITARGPRISVLLNGEKVLEKADATRSLKGAIGVQSHDRNQTIYFRSIQIQELK